MVHKIFLIWTQPIQRHQLRDRCSSLRLDHLQDRCGRLPSNPPWDRCPTRQPGLPPPRPLRGRHASRWQAAPAFLEGQPDRVGPTNRALRAGASHLRQARQVFPCVRARRARRAFRSRSGWLARIVCGSLILCVISSCHRGSGQGGQLCLLGIGRLRRICCRFSCAARWILCDSSCYVASYTSPNRCFKSN